MNEFFRAIGITVVISAAVYGVGTYIGPKIAKYIVNNEDETKSTVDNVVDTVNEKASEFTK